jgi:hypothetical protein
MLVLMVDAMVFLQTYLSGWATVPCSLWSATLFCDDQTAVNAGNVFLWENFSPRFFYFCLQVLGVRRFIGGCAANFRAN